MRLFLLCALCALCALYGPGRSWAAEPPAEEAKPKPVKIQPKAEEDDQSGKDSSPSLLQPDVNLIDAPTSAVLDYGGYSTLTRFYSNGGLLEHLSFGVFNRLNIGASLNIDRLIGRDKPTRIRAPNVQVKYRFYEGTRYLPSLAVGYDGQGFMYNAEAKRYNHRQRGFFVVATQEMGLPGLLIHPSLNISDFNSNSIFGSIPISYNIEDKVGLMFEWDNINNWSASRLNAGLRVYVTSALHIDFAARAMGQGGYFSDGSPRGPERVAQIKYSANF